MSGVTGPRAGHTVGLADPGRWAADSNSGVRDHKQCRLDLMLLRCSQRLNVFAMCRSWGRQATCSCHPGEIPAGALVGAERVLADRRMQCHRRASAPWRPSPRRTAAAATRGRTGHREPCRMISSMSLRSAYTSYGVGRAAGVLRSGRRPARRVPFKQVTDARSHACLPLASPDGRARSSGCSSSRTRNGRYPPWQSSTRRISASLGAKPSSSIPAGSGSTDNGHHASASGVCDTK